MFIKKKSITFAKNQKMIDKFSDPIGRLMGLRYKSHPWHGVAIGNDAPQTVTAFIEVVPTDTVKYEVDKGQWLFKNRPTTEIFQRDTGTIWVYSSNILRKINW